MHQTYNYTCRVSEEVSNKIDILKFTLIYKHGVCTQHNVTPRIYVLHKITIALKRPT